MVFAGCRAPESAGKTLSELGPSPGPDTAALDIRPISLDVTDDATVVAAVRAATSSHEVHGFWRF